MNQHRLLALSIFILTAAPTFAEEYRSETFEQGSHYGKKLFTYKNVTTREGGLTRISTQFFDLTGKVVIEEHGVLRGTEVIHYDLNHLQTDRSGSVDLKDGRVNFTYFKGKKKKEDSEKLGKTLVVPLSFAPFIHEHWGELQAGKDVDIRYAVWDRAETVGFELRKEGEEEIQGSKFTKIRMKPTSFVISAIVKPIYLYFSADGSRLMAMNGRVGPMIKNGDSWKDLDAEVLYHYPNP